MSAITKHQPSHWVIYKYSQGSDGKLQTVSSMKVLALNCQRHTTSMHLTSMEWQQWSLMLRVNNLIGFNELPRM